MSVIRWQIVVDYLALSAAFYAVLWWARSARAMRFVLAIIGLRALALLAARLDLFAADWVLNAAAILVILALLLVFQPELRRVFMQLDSSLRRWTRPAVAGSHTTQAIASASFALAHEGLGALIVLLRRDAIADLLEAGVVLDAEVSPELLQAIFQKVSPLHDGAVIVSGDRLLRANVVLPLTRRRDIPAFFGTRHRAATGLAERCDALVVAVSEERSEVTLFDADRIVPIPDAQRFGALLEGLVIPPQRSSHIHFRDLFIRNVGLKLAALGLAGIIWGMSFLASGATIRTVSVPIEFSSVPAGMQVVSQSADTLDIQVQGSPWVMDSVSLGKLVGRFNLQHIHAGTYWLHFDPHSLNLPPGISVDRVTPRSVRIQVAAAASDNAQAQ